MMLVGNVPRGRNSFEIFLLASCVLSGTTSLFGDAEPSTLQRALDAWMVVAWALLLTLGGGAGLFGIALRSASWGLLVERIGMYLLAGASLAYGIAVIVANGKAALFAGLFTIAFGLAAVARAIQITRTVRQTIQVTRTARRAARGGGK